MNNKKHNPMGVVLILIAVFLVQNLSYASIGDIDLSFGTEGLVVESEGYNQYAYGILATQDNKILQWGYDDENTDDVGVIVKYNADGSRDADFADNGRLRLNNVSAFSGFLTRVMAGLEFSDGSYVFAVQNILSFEGVYLIRVSNDGTIMDEFDSDGVRFVEFFGGSSEYFSGFALNDGEDIIMAFSWIGRALITKIDGASGALHDGSAGTDDFGGVGTGYTFEDFAGVGASGVFVRAMTVDTATNDIYLTGDITIGAETSTYLIKFLEVGSVDTSFGGGDGYIVLDLVPGGSERPSYVNIHENKINIVGWVNSGLTNSGYALRLDATGAYDVSFSVDGYLTYGFSWGSEQPTGAVMNDEGEIYVLMECPSPDSGCITRITNSGNIDTEFGPYGIGVVDFMTISGLYETPNKIDLTAKGRLIANGTRYETKARMVIAQYLLEQTDVTVEISADATSVDAGQSVTYTLTITNEGDYSTDDVDVNLTMPENAETTELTGFLSCTRNNEISEHVCHTGALNAGDAVTITQKVVFATAGAYSNTIQATPSFDDSNTANDSASIEITVNSVTENNDNNDTATASSGGCQFSTHTNQSYVLLGIMLVGLVLVRTRYLIS